MSKVIFDIAISLDGFIAGENRGPKNPLGDNGLAIHEWMFKQKVFWKHLNTTGGEIDHGIETDLFNQTLSRTGAYIMGKRMFEEGEANWPEDLFKLPVYVLTHENREPWIQKGLTTFFFINDGIHSALEKARADAKDKDVRLQGGANLIQRYLNAGLVDEFIVHIAPVVIGSGIRLFDNLDRTAFKVEIVDVQHSDMATHMRYRVISSRQQQRLQTAESQDILVMPIERASKDHGLFFDTAAYQPRRGDRIIEDRWTSGGPNPEGVTGSEKENRTGRHELNADPIQSIEKGISRHKRFQIP